MQINRKSFGTLKSDRYGRVPVMDEWPLRQVLLYFPEKSIASCYTEQHCSRLVFSISFKTS